MDKRIQDFTLKRLGTPACKVMVGDIVRAHIRVTEGSKERVQIFEGVVLKTQGHAHTRTLTVRKVSDGVGVEKTLPFASPNLSKVEVVSNSKVRRARLYYLRKLKGRASRLDVKKPKTTSTPKTLPASKEASAPKSTQSN